MSMSPENHDLEAAWAALHSGEPAMALDLAAKLQAAEAEQLRGLACFHLGRHAEAMEHLGNFAAQNGLALDWFNYANAAAMAHSPERALQAFAQCKASHGHDKQAANISLPMMTWYFCKAMQEAGNLKLVGGELEVLRQGYLQARITDAHYLYTRGMPAFEDFLEIFSAWLALLPVDEANARWQELNNNVDAQGKAALLLIRPRK
jgi:tetratricopeptide (TPR) repeat protein